MKKRRGFLKAALFFLAGGLLAGGILAFSMREYIFSSMDYGSIRKEYVSVPEDMPEKETEIIVAEEPEYFPDIEVDVDGLLGDNPDFAAWLYFGDGRVDLPVVQEREYDINYYAKHTFDYKKRSAGCVYAGYDLPLGTDKGNVFLYGHNMADGSMFGSLKKIYRGNVPLEDPYFYLYTSDHEKVKYRILSIFTVKEDDMDFYASPTDDAGYDEYLERSLSAGSILEEHPLTEREEACMERRPQLMTLYTCYGASGTDRRLYIQAMETARETF